MSEISRLQWQCRRSMLELELLLRGYLDNCYECDSKEVQAAFSELLTFSDQKLQDLLFNEEPAKQARIVDVITRIKNQPLAP